MTPEDMYPAKGVLATWRTYTPVPPDIQEAILQVLQTRITFRKAKAYRTFCTGLRSVPRNKFRTFGEDIRFFVDSHGWRTASPRYTRTKSARIFPNLFLFSGDGYEREAALNALSLVPSSAYEIVILCQLINDWAEPVRSAAMKALERLLPKTDHAVIIEAASFLIGRLNSWDRLSSANAARLKDLLLSPDVVVGLVERLLQNAEPAPDYLLKQLVIHPAIDPLLPGLWADVSLRPSLRVIALKSLITAQAKWFERYGREWVDKSYGISRRVPVFASRPMTISVNRSDLYRQALNDKSLLVRKVALQLLIDTNADISDYQSEITDMLGIPHPAIIERAQFLLKTRDH